MMLSFNFAGKDSFLDFGIVITSRPVLPSPKRRVTYIDIPKRDSSLRFDDGTFEDITIAVECTIKGNDVINKLDAIKAWLLLSGESDLIFSFQNTKKYKSQVVNSIDFKQVFRVACRFVVIFNCQPFKYEISNDPITIMPFGWTTIKYPGTVPSRPIIKAYCKGEGSFKINEMRVLISNIVDYIILDSELEEAYYLVDGEIQNANNMVSGEFPILENGSNSVSIIDGITKLEITKNMRWL